VKTPERAAAYQGYPCAEQRFLPTLADARKQDLP